MIAREQFVLILKRIKVEREQREALKNSPEFQELEDKINKLTNERDTLLQSVGDSSDELKHFKAGIIAIMQEQGEGAVDGIKARVRVKKEVNTKRLMDELQGDLDHFFVLAKVQQNTLKDFAKSDPRKKDLLACIEEVGQDIIDIELTA